METVALVVLMALMVTEGVVLVLWPAKVKAFIAWTGETALRVIGVLELVVVILVLLLAVLGRRA